LKKIPPTFFIAVLHGVERVLPVPVLFWLLFPVALSRALLHRIHQIRRRKPSATILPACLDQAAAVPRPKLPRLPLYFNRIIELIPGSLARPKWQARCPIDGIEPVRQALAEKRRVLLTFPHFSLYWEIRNWLRGAGLPVAFYAGADSTARPEVRRQKDRWALFPEVPTVFNSDQLPDAIKFVRTGKPLLIAMDGERGRQLDIPVCDGWIFQAATGPLRIASRHDALLFPCVMVVEGLWRYRIKIGPPVPGDLLAEGKEREAAQHLLKEVLPDIKRYPDQCRSRFLERFKPSAPSSILISKAS
jgi:lauroyl/myristoyl acyltransferase